MPLNDLSETQVIHGLMQDIVDSIVQVYQDANVALPDRHILAVGEIPHDCEQVGVSLDQLYIGGPGDQAEQPMRCEAPRTVGLTVQIVRCIPTPKDRRHSVTPAEMNESTERLATDFWLLMDGIMASEAANWLGALVDIGSTPPDGGYQAVVATVAVGVP